MGSHFDEGDLTRALVTIQVLNDDITVMFKPPLLTEDIVNARHHFIPLVMIPVPERHTAFNYTLTLSVLFIKSQHISDMPHLLALWEIKK